ncbi:DEAD/DEAH box helicase [Lysobacter terrae]
MSHWMLEALGDSRVDALRHATRAKVLQEFGAEEGITSDDLVERTAQVLETVVMDVLSASNWQDDQDQIKVLRSSASDAYRLYRALPISAVGHRNAETLLRLSALAVLGDQGADVARYLREIAWPNLNLDSEDWYARTFGTVVDVWLRLIRKNGWTDRDLVLERIAALRDAQAAFEAEHLSRLGPASSRAGALELVCLYHIARAAEVLALYVTEGAVDGNYQVERILDMHFDRAIAACGPALDFRLEPLTRLLAATAKQLAQNAIWTVTRAVNSRVTRFVRELVGRGRGQKAIFDVLPPQRRALAEQGLLGSSRRAVVVSLPTSSGKTLIAQFRILQALNQYDSERGWVAYLAPTRTLVRQVARRLRRDFDPLGVIVEQVSPALEIDGVEAEMLKAGAGAAFRVLVTTPEKLDLMLRQDWEAKIGRPLTLVVVDEAHNLQEGSRGLKLELLLSTINSECQNAQFLLLTPFISNARDVARWLGGQNSEDVSLSVDWQPNDRVIGIVRPERGVPRQRNSFGCVLTLETVHTTRATLAIDSQIRLVEEADCGTFSQMSNPGDVAAAAAHSLAKRGPVIVMHSTPPFVWSLATKLKGTSTPRAQISADIRLVQDFLSLEMGQDFPLIELLSHGIGVHHAGLSDDTRSLMEWLFEAGELDYLVATTTIAQGVNFPVSGVVMAATQYFRKGFGQEDMPSADFWNIAGRAGRVDQNAVGIVALAAANDARSNALRAFISRQTGELNSSLILLVREAGDLIDDLGRIVFLRPEWSSFLQYLTHTYQEMGRPDSFGDQVEQVLRGTFGFEKLRASDPSIANRLLAGIRSYVEELASPNQPIKLVDSTGFSLQSIKSAMVNARGQGVSRESWSSNLFAHADDALPRMMGVLLQVPELRENLQEVTGGRSADGDKLASILKDWVNGRPIPEIASDHFAREDRDGVSTLTVCGQNLFGKLTQTAAWGLGALLSITGGDLEDDEFARLNNLASKAFYGVSSEDAIALRLLGVPRLAAEPLAARLREDGHRSASELRGVLRTADMSLWTQSLGAGPGEVYRRVWRILEGLDQ